MAQNSGAGGIVSPSPRLTPPAGLEQIVATFGGIYQYIRPDGGFDVHWREDFLVVVNLPFPLRLSWDHARTVSRMPVTIKWPRFLPRSLTRDLQLKVTSFGGCFSFRGQRTGASLSTHSWGIAVDPNPETNVQGS
jgi:hypothetical protein